MLILTRKRFEEIRIGDDIRIKVIRTGRNTVKLGIEAPSNVRVLRGELTEFDQPQPPKIRKGVLGLSVRSECELEQCSDQFPHPHIA
ncbi:MAG: carbon storage regulator [Planctomycetaceae bacterium]